MKAETVKPLLRSAKATTGHRQTVPHRTASRLLAAAAAAARSRHAPFARSGSALRSDLMALDIQLQNYIVDLQSNDMFLELNGIDELARKMVETEKDVTYPLVYLLVKLVLTLPVATATVERSFSAMKYIKNLLRNRMGDQWMNDCLVTYIESDVFDSIDNEAIMQRYQAMKTRRRIL
uniref:HAT C-terminal dimerisation domain-containing protein n=1 Tax=Fagus sylvatica TaxID=28930 RepID=A0A2N9IEE2_FAGSY